MGTSKIIFIAVLVIGSIALVVYLVRKNKGTTGVSQSECVAGVQFTGDQAVAMSKRIADLKESTTPSQLEEAVKLENQLRCSGWNYQGYGLVNQSA